MVSLNYTITKEDYAHFFVHVFWDAKGRRKKRMLSILKQVLYAAAFIAIIFYAGFRTFSRFTILLFLLVLIVSLLPLLNGRNDLQTQAEDIAENPDNATIFIEHTLTATDSDLQIKTDISETKIYWKAFLKKTETATHYFLFENALQAIIIPKRAFGNKEELSEFQKILSRNLSLEAEVKDDINAGE